MSLVPASCLCPYCLQYNAAHTYVGRDVSYSQSYVSNPNYAFKLLDTSNLNVRNINLQWYDVFDWVKDGNYETKKIFEWSSGNYGTTTVINPGTSTTNVHYSVFADYDSNADGRSNIKSGDSVRVNYMLADGTTGYRDLTAGSSVDARCSHVFKFVPSEGKLLIENTFYNKDKNNTNTITVNTCANPTNSQSPTWAQTIPF